ncbi:MAG: hypothetical protein PHT33_05780 [bacterium]|nr:hypothetical protein [bacterium]
MKMIIRDLADMGVNTVIFFEQNGRGGAFLHPTRVAYAQTEKDRMKGRDFLKELLEETKRYDMKVWLAWTTPSGKYPGTEFAGLNDAGVMKIYRDEIEEIGKNYGGYKNLAGIVWHEANCSEAYDGHRDDIKEFTEFCRQRFGEKYEKASMPSVDPEDKWWRRFYLYRINVMSNFVEAARKAGDKYGLKVSLLSYIIESFSGESWRWGYDPVSLEKICNNQWYAGYLVEAAKPYQTINGAWIDFGPSYKGQIMPRNYSSAFHGGAVSFFEHRWPIYIEAMRAYYSANKSFTERYGDVYNGYLGQGDKELSLFYGKENMKNWLALMADWQGGESRSSVAVAVNPVPFVMRYPYAPGVEYDKKVRSLMEGLTQSQDVDGLVMGSKFSLDPANLLKYRLIIMPEDMGSGLSDEMVQSLKGYMNKGGRLLVLSTALLQSKPDLTGERDLTEDLCGVSITGSRTPGYVRPAGAPAAPDGGKFWASGVMNLKVTGGNVMVKDSITGSPLLVRKGNAYFSAIGQGQPAYFAAIVASLSQPSVILAESKGIKILETVKKDNVLCISLWGQGTAKLSLKTSDIGLKGKAFQIKDIVTGAVIAAGKDDKALLAGIPVETKYLNQPRILAVGLENDLKTFNGIYPSAEVFTGLGIRTVPVENPEVPLIIPDKPGLKVGVYGGAGASSIINALNKESDINCYSLPRLDGSTLSGNEVVIIPQEKGKMTFFNATASLIKRYVEEGGKVLLLHHAVGYRAYNALFPEIGKGHINMKLDTVLVTGNHPVVSGVSSKFSHAYNDHITLEKGEKGEVLARDEKGNAVIVAGSVGDGKVVLNGMITGYAVRMEGDLPVWQGEKEPEGGELKVLLNAVRWLGMKGDGANDR